MEHKKTKKISKIFYGCYLLKSLPEISKWDISNVIDMNHLFYECCSLESFPDISKWNTEKVEDISGLFNGCNSIKMLPDISRWNTYNLTSMKNIFYGSKSLINFPDISKWNYHKLKNIEDIKKIKDEEENTSASFLLLNQDSNSFKEIEISAGRQKSSPSPLISYFNLQSELFKENNDVCYENFYE